MDYDVSNIINGFIKTSRDVGNSLLKLQSRVDLSSVTTAFRKIAQVQNKMNEFFNSDRFRALEKSIVEFSSLYLNYLEANEQFILIMLGLGWSPPMDLLPGTVLEIVEKQSQMESQEFSSYVDDLLVRYYDEDLLRFKLEQWKNDVWWQQRLPIVQSAVEAHINQEYFLSIPTLLPQIEGIIVDGFGHRGYMGGKTLDRYISTLLSDTEVDASYSSIAKQFFYNVVLASFEHGELIESTLSRHAILHGADIAYGTSTNSLKTILLFDYIQDMFQLVCLNNSNVYHKANCPVLLRSRGVRMIFKNHVEAKKSNKRPCKICMQF